MKKIILFSAFVAILLCVVSCDDSTKNGGGVEEKQPSYLLSKMKYVTDGVSQDFMEVKYASTDPMVVSEFIFFGWYGESSVAPARKMLRTKEGASVDKLVFTNIVKTATTMTLDVGWQGSYGVTEDYGSFDITLNAEGNATLIKQTSLIADLDDAVITVKYNAGGYISEFLYTEGEQVKSSYIFTYDGANLSKLAIVFTYYNYDMPTKMETDSFVFEFSGFTTNNKGGIMHPALSDEGIFEVFTSLGILGKPAAMLPSRGDVDDDSFIDFTYTKDENDCISTFSYLSTFMENGVPDSYTTKYACEYIAVTPKK